MQKTTEKAKLLAEYLEQLRKIHTNNCTNTGDKLADEHLIAANIKVYDAILHMEKAFNILMD